MVPPTAALLCVLLLSTAARSQRCTTNPFLRHFTLGNLSALVTSDGPISLPAAAPLFAVPAPIIENSYTTLFRSISPVSWSQNNAVIDLPAGRVLIDTGGFNTGIPPFANAGLLKQNLIAAGITPESIDVVLLTHGHPDHVSGLIDENGARAFPNARLIAPTVEHDFWTAEPFVNPSASLPNETAEAFRSFYVRAVGPYEEAGLLRTVGDGEFAMRGVRYALVGGHTPGHSVIEILNSGERLVVVGDAWFTQPDQLRHPEWTRPGVDTDAEMAAESRFRLMQKLADERSLVLAYHEDFPGLGYVVRVMDSFDWVVARPELFGTAETSC
eukprot:GFKZ01014423.1.p1 GENE.GFKZ01014423.1~~GFKZ01014423.1.p1  ORF type:complete len:328 (+),score=35.38 GFKZ01014423.1:458-1441(+)